MKKLFLFLIFSASLLFSQTGQTDEKTMKPIFKNIIEGVSGLEEKGFEVVRIEADIFTSEGKSSFRTLSTGWKYGILATADWRVKDLNITVYQYINKEWVKIASEDTEGEYAGVSITPKVTAQFRIDITPLKFNQSYTAGHYGLIVYHE